MTRNPPLKISASLALLALAATLFAQYQKSMQVNTAIYAGPSLGSIQYGGQNPVNNPLLPSQERQRLYQSGMLPSEIRGGAIAAGPLAPGGVAAFTPEGSALQRAVGTPPPAPTGPMAVPTGSMGYANVTPSRPVSPDLRPAPISGAAMGTAPINATAR
jgi:hypothetical protein